MVSLCLIVVLTEEGRRGFSATRETRLDVLVERRREGGAKWLFFYILEAHRSERTHGNIATPSYPLLFFHPISPPQPFQSQLPNPPKISSAISRLFVCSAKCPASTNFTAAPGESLLNASAPGGMEIGSPFPQGGGGRLCIASRWRGG